MYWIANMATPFLVSFVFTCQSILLNRPFMSRFIFCFIPLWFNHQCLWQTRSLIFYFNMALCLLWHVDDRDRANLRQIEFHTSPIVRLLWGDRTVRLITSNQYPSIYLSIYLSFYCYRTGWFIYLFKIAKFD